jgi:predicted RNA-binding protein with PUA-like domain
MKSEPDVFSIRHLKERPGQREHWDGVRNYTARNNLREMSVGDGILFYHSSADVIGVAGLAEVVRAAYPDPTALDPASEYHDPKAKPDKNPWVMVDVKFKREFKQVVTLDVLRATPGLENMLVNRPGTRLSVQPVTPEEFAIVTKLAKS